MANIATGRSQEISHFKAFKRSKFVFLQSFKLSVPSRCYNSGDNVEENNRNDFVCVLVLPETQLETTIRGNLTF